MFEKKRRNNKKQKSVVMHTINVEREKNLRNEREKKKRDFMKFVLETGNSFE